MVSPEHTESNSRVAVFGTVIPYKNLCAKVQVFHSLVAFWGNRGPRKQWMDGWKSCNFMSFSTIFQSYQEDEMFIMKCCVQWNSVYG